MDTSLPAGDLARFVQRLLTRFLPDGRDPGLDRAHVDRALERTEYCFSHIRRKYYQGMRGAVFDHLNGDHMASFLWFLSSTVWRDDQNEELATRLSYLNKMMHGLDLFYSVPMPDVFLLVHPVGTVLGRASYSDYLVVYQNCTVGATADVYPTFGEGVALYSRSSVLGDCNVGSNVVFGANSLVIDTAVPDDTIVVGAHPAQRYLSNPMTVRMRCFETRGAESKGGAS